MRKIKIEMKSKFQVANKNAASFLKETIGICFKKHNTVILSKEFYAIMAHVYFSLSEASSASLAMKHSAQPWLL